MILLAMALVAFGGVLLAVTREVNNLEKRVDTLDCYVAILRAKGILAPGTRGDDEKLK